jgi:hypothetical protein
VFQLAHPELEREFPALQTVDELAGNLPVPRNRFVDRAALIEQITGLVVDTAVVTLTGPGNRQDEAGVTSGRGAPTRVLRRGLARGSRAGEHAERVAAVVLEM